MKEAVGSPDSKDRRDIYGTNQPEISSPFAASVKSAFSSLSTDVNDSRNERKDGSINTLGNQLHQQHQQQRLHNESSLLDISRDESDIGSPQYGSNEEEVMNALIRSNQLLAEDVERSRKREGSLLKTIHSMEIQLQSLSSSLKELEKDAESKRVDTEKRRKKRNGSSKINKLDLLLGEGAINVDEYALKLVAELEKSVPASHPSPTPDLAESINANPSAPPAISSSIVDHIDANILAPEATPLAKESITNDFYSTPLKDDHISRQRVASSSIIKSVLTDAISNAIENVVKKQQELEEQEERSEAASTPMLKAEKTVPTKIEDSLNQILESDSPTVPTIYEQIVAQTPAKVAIDKENGMPLQTPPAPLLSSASSKQLPTSELLSKSKSVLIDQVIKPSILETSNNIKQGKLQGLSSQMALIFLVVLLAISIALLILPFISRST